MDKKSIAERLEQMAQEIRGRRTTVAEEAARVIEQYDPYDIEEVEASNSTHPKEQFVDIIMKTTSDDKRFGLSLSKQLNDALAEAGLVQYGYQSREHTAGSQHHRVWFRRIDTLGIAEHDLEEEHEYIQ